MSSATSLPCDSAPRTWLLAAAVWIATFITFWPATRGGFIDVDDPVYVSSNPIVQRGLTVAGVKEAFTHVFGYWQPLTWLSLETDAQIYGDRPFGFHLTSVLLHACNAALLLITLKLMTGSIWRSAAAAALFALHPLRVESVAWVAERKTLVFAFFGFLALIAYLRYVRGASRVWYGAVIGFYVLSLMAKPTLITLPVLLLLLDFWPLQRFTDRKQARSLLLEKAPLFVMAGIVAVVVPLTMADANANASLANMGIGMRLGNFLVSYARYPLNMVRLSGLAYDYPLQPRGSPMWEIGCAAACLVIVTGFALIMRRRGPCLIAGWLWFCIAMLPTSGLLQTSENAMADRYSYFPTIGLIIMLAWSLPGVSAAPHAAGHTPRLPRPIARRSIGIAAALTIVLGLLTIFTRRQISYWSDTLTLFQHTLAVTQNNYDAQYILATQLLQRGDRSQALRLITDALRIEPNTPDAQLTCGDLLWDEGNPVAAAIHYHAAMRLDPALSASHAQWLYTRGVAAARRQDHVSAAGLFRRSLLLNRESAAAHAGLGIELAAQDDLKGAISEYSRALRLESDDVESLYNLALAELKLDEVRQAIEHLRAAQSLVPDDKTIRQQLAHALEIEQRNSPH